MSDWVWISHGRARPHWYEQDEAVRTVRLAEWTAVRAQSEAQGGTCHGRYHVRGQSDYATVEIWNFTSADAAFDHWSRLTRAGYAEWFVSANNIGLREEVDG